VHGAAGSSADGIVKHYWSPVKEGADFEFTPTLSPLEPFRDYVTIISDTDLNNARSQTLAEEGADHTRSSSTFLTAAHPKQTEGSDILAGTSIDQLFAQKFGQETPLPSIQLCIENVGSLNGACGYGYSCVYANTISWASPTQPLPMEMDPRVAFERLFGDGSTAKERLARRRADRSILDAITENLARLRQGLDPSDRSRLNDYFDNVREVERRIQKIEQYNMSGQARALPSAPTGVPDSFEEHVKLMFDLQVLALQADITRVISFQLAREVSTRTYPQIGVPEAHHPTSHHQNDPEKLAKLEKINTYHVSLFAYLLEKLKATRDGDGSLLDNSMYLFGSGMGNPDVHDHSKLPILVAGGAAGRMKGGRHINYAEPTPLSNLLLTMLHKAGIESESFADSTGRVDELVEPLSL
jgi:hypothetical protein